MVYNIKTLNLGSYFTDTSITIKNIGFVPDEIIIKSISYLETSAITSLTNFGYVRQLWSDMVDEGILCTFVRGNTLNNTNTVIPETSSYTTGTQGSFEIKFKNTKPIDNREFNFQIQSLAEGNGPGTVLTQPVILNWSIMVEFRKYSK